LKGVAVTTSVLASAVLMSTAGLALAQPTAARVTHKPTATIAFGADVSVKGKYFKKGEKVTVTLSTTTTSEKWTRKAKATATGAFTISFGHISLNSCAQYTLKVVGSTMSRYTTSHDLVPC
jgi:hypothetical protein